MQLSGRVASINERSRLLHWHFEAIGFHSYDFSWLILKTKTHQRFTRIGRTFNRGADLSLVSFLRMDYWSLSSHTRHHKRHKNFANQLFQDYVPFAFLIADTTKNFNARGDPEVALCSFASIVDIIERSNFVACLFKCQQKSFPIFVSYKFGNMTKRGGET